MVGTWRSCGDVRSCEDIGYRGGHRGQLGWGGYKDIEAIILVDEEIEG